MVQAQLEIYISIFIMIVYIRQREKLHFSNMFFSIPPARAQPSDERNIMQRRLLPANMRTKGCENFSSFFSRRRNFFSAQKL
jgi:hypothetical protein